MILEQTPEGDREVALELSRGKRVLAIGKSQCKRPLGARVPGMFEEQQRLGSWNVPEQWMRSGSGARSGRASRPVVKMLLAFTQREMEGLQ